MAFDKSLFCHVSCSCLLRCAASHRKASNKPAQFDSAQPSPTQPLKRRTKRCQGPFFPRKQLHSTDCCSFQTQKPGNSLDYCKCNRAQSLPSSKERVVRQNTTCFRLVFADQQRVRSELRDFCSRIGICGSCFTPELPTMIRFTISTSRRIR